MKKNIGPVLALYPVPTVVVGAMVDGKPSWTLVAHAGTVAHSHLMVSLVQAHYVNRGIRETKRLSVNIVDESWLKEADRMGTTSGNKTDKSEAFAWTMGENGAPLIDKAKEWKDTAAETFYGKSGAGLSLPTTPPSTRPARSTTAASGPSSSSSPPTNTS